MTLVTSKCEVLPIVFYEKKYTKPDGFGIKKMICWMSLEQVKIVTVVFEKKWQGYH